MLVDCAYTAATLLTCMLSHLPPSLPQMRALLQRGSGREGGGGSVGQHELQQQQQRARGEGGEVLLPHLGVLLSGE